MNCHVVKTSIDASPYSIACSDDTRLVISKIEGICEEEHMQLPFIGLLI